jgi:hypothetical protein
MSLKIKRPSPQQEEPSVHPPAFGGVPAVASESSTAPTVSERSVAVQHGIHRGQFPVGGLRVREARETLHSLMNIDPQAVAVIDGQIVDEDTVIGQDVTMLSFVKPSAVKG